MQKKEKVNHLFNNNDGNTIDIYCPGLLSIHWVPIQYKIELSAALPRFFLVLQIGRGMMRKLDYYR